MAEHFGHERLKVYQKGMPFASMRNTLRDNLPRALRRAITLTVEPKASC